MQTRLSEELWWKAEKGKVHRAAFSVVRRLQTEQGDVFDRFVKLENLYDPNTPDGDGEVGHVTENVIATGVDTVSAIVATADIRARYLTDGADWSQTRRARHLEFYSEEIESDLKILPKCRRAFKEAVKKGTGVTKASTVFDKIRIELVAVENVVVDQMECRDGREPKHLHQWDSVDADELCARYPDYEEEIERARGRVGDWAHSAGRYKMPANEVAVLYSWRLPVGVRGQKGYRPGREVVSIDGCDLYDAEYHDELFPFAVMVWSDRLKSWYGISGAERIMGIQRALNRRNWQIERTLDQSAILTTYIRPADAAMPVKTTKIGQFGIVKGDWPVTPQPPAVHAETYQSRLTLRASGLEELGVNQMAAHATKPAGIESGVAIRELHDATTQRFAPQEQAFEQLVLDTIWLALMQCKKLDKRAPKMVRRGRFGARTIKWADVDPREMRISMHAASNTTRMPWGRAQTVMELAQAGIVGTDSARRMLANLDLDQELSLYMSALESIEGDLDDIADGLVIVPEPFTNAEMAVWRGQGEYLKWQRNSAPEEVLEVLRQYVAIAADLVAQASAPMNQNMQMPAVAETPEAMLAGGPPAPPAGQPTAALAPEAMDLIAS
jgi:hypothetical protein